MLSLLNGSFLDRQCSSGESLFPLFFPLSGTHEKHLIIWPASLKKRKENLQGAISVASGILPTVPFQTAHGCYRPQGLLWKFHTPSVRLDSTSCMWPLKTLKRKGLMIEISVPSLRIPQLRTSGSVLIILAVLGL